MNGPACTMTDSIRNPTKLGGILRQKGPLPLGGTRKKVMVCCNNGLSFNVQCSKHVTAALTAFCGMPVALLLEGKVIG
jgi:hypothetical protein